MIDITNSRIIDYGDGRQVTVYFDHDDTSKYYIVPQPRLVTEADGTPHFSLTKYIQNEGGVAGTCTFDVELHVPDDALSAVQRMLGNNRGQFDWVGVESYFTYELAGEVTLAPGTASMYGENRVTYVVELDSDEAVTTFVNAFSKGGALSPFTIEYDATVLTNLPAVDVTVSYDAEIAIAYETQWKDEKNTWGQTKKVAAGVKQNLRESGAGKVDFEWGPEIGEELKMRVKDWAWTTLEGLVAKALDEATKQSGGKNPVQYAGSFTRQYSENQIVEWSFITSNPLPAFDERTWEEQVYRETDLRQLVVDFSLLGELTDSDNGAFPVERVDVSVDYPTLQDTFSLHPTSGSSRVFTAPGHFDGGKFQTDFTYTYKVFFDNGSTYVSDPVTTSENQVVILPSQLGIRQVTFTGSNIPFVKLDVPVEPVEPGAEGPGVEKVIIDLFFERPGGEPNKVQSQEITANGSGDGDSAVFSSFFKLPLTNTYAYRTRYQMSDGQTLTVAAEQAFGEPNKDLVLLTSPFEEVEFGLRARKLKDSESIPENITLHAAYKDPANDLHVSHSWDWDPEFKNGKSLVKAEPWIFKTVPNPEGAYYELNGEVLTDTGDCDQLVNQLFVQAKRRSLTIEACVELYSVKIDASQIAWDEVEAVHVTLFQIEKDQVGALDLTDPAMVGALLSSPLTPLTENRRIHYDRFDVLPPADGESAPQHYYLIERPRDSKEITYFFSAQYSQKDGGVKYADAEEHRLSLILPCNGTEDCEPVPPISRHTVSFDG